MTIASLAIDHDQKGMKESQVPAHELMNGSCFSSNDFSISQMLWSTPYLINYYTQLQEAEQARPFANPLHRHPQNLERQVHFTKKSHGRPLIYVRNIIFSISSLRIQALADRIAGRQLPYFSV